MSLKYLIDANLPYRFSLWATPEYIHVRDLNDEWSDAQIWEYAKARQLTIITKDTDFSDKILLTEPPPRVIHLKLRNLKMSDFHITLTKIWLEVCTMSDKYKLIRIFIDRIEGVN